jgi:shikimate kinase
MKQVYLIGMMGAGKTAVGEALARELNMKFMDLDDHIVKQVKPLTENIYLHVMGEPLLHPEFPEIIRICTKHNMHVSVTTNGSQMETSNAQSLLGPILQNVNISLHSLYSSDTPEKQSERLDEILNFTKQAFVKHPKLYVSYRLWNLLASNESLKSEQNEWICRKISETFAVKIPDVGHSSGRKSRCLLNRLYLHLDTCFEWPEINETAAPQTVGFCHGLGAHAAILADGTIVPCCLDRNGVTTLGNCFEESFETVINSPRALAISEGFQKGQLVEKLCQHCSFCSRFSKRLQNKKPYKIIGPDK